MDNKLFKLLEKIHNDLLNFPDNCLNCNNELIDKCLYKDENGNYVEDKQHWNKMLSRCKELQGLVEKLPVRLMTVDKVSDFKIARRMLNDELIVWNCQIFLAFEDKCLLEDTRSKCIKMFNRTYETALWYIDTAEDHLNEEIIEGQDQLSRLKTNLSDTQIALLFDLLVKGNFISATTSKDGFLWAFGKPNEKKPEQWKPIIWLKNKQLLRELLTPVKSSDLKIADMERIVPSLFNTTKDGQLYLAKNRPVPSTDSDLICNIIKNLATI